MTRSRPFQFGIGSLLLLTTIGAVVIAIGMTLQVPVVWQIGIAGYAFFLLFYLCFRLPYLIRISFGEGSPWHEAKQKRADLQRQALKREEST